MEKHRREQIIDAVTHHFGNHLLIRFRRNAEGIRIDQRERFAQDNGYTDLFDEPDPDFPSHVVTVQKRYLHWTTLDEQKAIPALLIGYEDPGNQRTQWEGGADTSARYASLGEREEALPIQVIAVVKEIPNSEDSQLRKPLTEQIADMIYSIERLTNTAYDLGVEGVCKVEMDGLPRTSAGRISAVVGTPFEVLIFRIIVTHIYDASTSV